MLGTCYFGHITYSFKTPYSRPRGTAAIISPYILTSMEYELSKPFHIKLETFIRAAERRIMCTTHRTAVLYIIRTSLQWLDK
jgi:hypothetical protein